MPLRQAAKADGGMGGLLRGLQARQGRVIQTIASSYPNRLYSPMVASARGWSEYILIFSSARAASDTLSQV